MTELEWRAGLDEREIAAVRALAAAATEVDGVAPLGEHVLLHLGRGGAEAAHLLAHQGATLVGVAHLDVEGAAGGSAELTVHPEHRRAGLGTELVRELLAEQPAAGALRLWAHGGHPAATAIAARLGLRKVRELLQLRLTMTEPPLVPPPPAGVRIRAFRVGVDEPEFLRVNNAAFDWHPEQGGWGQDEITRREHEPWFDPDGFLLAVDPGARGLHLGHVLTLAGLRHLYERGLRTVLLYVEADNAAAVGLYSALQFTRWHTDVMYAR